MFQAAAVKPSTLSNHSGVLALIATLLIWSSYFVALRSGAQSTLTGFDMALLRFLLPSLILIPVLIKAKSKILRVKKRYLCGIAIGAGLPFYLLSVIAAGHVQAVIGSLLVPGVSPVFVTLIAVFFYKERLSKRKISGLSLVLIGIGLLIASRFDTELGQGVLGSALYILAAACWSIYTVSVKMSKLSGLELAGVLNISASIGLLIVLPFNNPFSDEAHYFSSNLLHASWSEILPQLLVMGFFCGLVTVITYGHAINRLGAETSACWGAVTPVLVCVMAYSILGETLDFMMLVAMAVIILGVICANYSLKSK